MCDFGISRILKGDKAISDDDGRLRGSMPYMAPERLRSAKFGRAADVYSFGILFWQVLTNTGPFEDLEALFEEMNDLSEFMAHFRREICERHKRPATSAVPKAIYKPACRVALMKLLKRCWSPQPAARPAFAELVTQLDDGLLQGLFDVEEAREFWHHHYMNEGKCKFF